MHTPVKTNAVRLFERAGVPFELRAYVVDPDDLSAETVARKVGLPEAQVLKTLLAKGARTGYCFALVPAGAELDRKRLAKALGDRDAELVALKDVQPLTGYVRGGVTALGAKKDFPVLFDEPALAHAVVSVSAGVRGTQVLLSPADYVRVTRARVALLSRPR